MSGEAGVVADVRVGLVTAPSAAAAERLVRALVDEHLVACGNIVPGLTSIYRWKGVVECEAEVLVMLKTTVAAVPRLLSRVVELHPYDVPEVLLLEVAAGYGPYMAWMRENILVADEG